MTKRTSYVRQSSTWVGAAQSNVKPKPVTLPPIKCLTEEPDEPKGFVIENRSNRSVKIMLTDQDGFKTFEKIMPNASREIDPAVCRKAVIVRKDWNDRT